MHLISRTLHVTRDGYVKTGDELDKHIEDVERIVEHQLALLEEELDQAGYRLEVVNAPRR